MCRSKYISMSINRHKTTPRDKPPSAEEIFGEQKKLTTIELGMLQMQILWLLQRRPTHGYEIMETLNTLKSTKIAQGTVYPALKTLTKLGYIKREQLDDKIIYHITPSGKKILNETCLDFTRTFFGVFQDFVCHRCVGEGEKK
jgi:DNA-binding MarR family transcriptional regulator